MVKLRSVKPTIVGSIPTLPVYFKEFMNPIKLTKLYTPFTHNLRIWLTWNFYLLTLLTICLCFYIPFYGLPRVFKSLDILILEDRLDSYGQGLVDTQMKLDSIKEWQKDYNDVQASKVRLRVVKK